MVLVKTAGTCPYCKESIHPSAVKCKHCHSDLTAALKTRRSWFAGYNTFRFGFLTGFIFCVVILILGYFQFLRD